MKIALRTFIPTLSVALVLALATACSKAPTNNEAESSASESEKQTENNQPDQVPSTSTKTSSSNSSSLPEFSASTVEGKNLSHKDLLGNVTVINYWGTWCPPCVEEIPHFQETYEDLSGKKFTILGIAIPQPRGSRGTLDDVKSFMKKHEMTYPVVMHDSIPMDKFQEEYGRISGLPTTLVLDQSGQLKNSFIGYTSKEKLRNAVDPLIEQQ